jgi:hypothetical protein
MPGLCARSRPAVGERLWWKGSSLRATWQVSPRNKIAAFWDEQSSCQQQRRRSDDIARAPRRTISAGCAYQAVWNSPISNHILLEAAFSGMGFSYGREKQGNNRDLIQVNDQVGPITYRSMNWRPAVSFTPRMRASMAYVSGAHNVKVGWDQMDNYSDRIYLTNNPGMFYRFNNGVPNQVTLIINNFRQQEHVRGGAAYAQDQWTSAGSRSRAACATTTAAPTRRSRSSDRIPGFRRRLCFRRKTKSAAIAT